MKAPKGYILLEIRTRKELNNNSTSIGLFPCDSIVYDGQFILSNGKYINPVETLEEIIQKIDEAQRADEIYMSIDSTLFDDDALREFWKSQNIAQRNINNIGSDDEPSIDKKN